jgi:uncharacterized lipoprotein YddW (UPF0748 family)
MCAVLLAAPPLVCGEIPGRGLFVSVIQEPQVLSRRSAITALLRFAKRSGVGDLYVQVYRANKSWFPSQLCDQSPYLRCLNNVGEDPLALLIKEAHASGLRVHAWLNLLSLSDNAAAPILKKHGASILTRNLKKKNKLSDYRIDGQYFLEPGDPRVRDELSGIVGELLARYPELDGIEFDYIRYPDKHPFYGYTRANIDRFKKATGAGSIEEGSAAWADWKRRQVTELLELLAGKSRGMNPGIIVSTTACAPYSRAYLEAFQDWPSWVKSGLVDFVALMSYPRKTEEFTKFMKDARARVADFRKVNVAVGAYKQLGSSHVFA